jgi:hypothetical protein
MNKTRAWNGQNASLSHMYLDHLSKDITASTIPLVYFLSNAFYLRENTVRCVNRCIAAFLKR